MSEARARFAPQQWHRDGYTISTDAERFDVDAIHAYLARSTWAAGIERPLVERSLRHSLGFGLFDESGAQVGFARVTTDYATFAYLADVYVLEDHRGRGLGLWLSEVVLSHPELQGLRRWLLATSTARDLYLRVGWTMPARPEIFMEISVPDIYQRIAPTEP